jgi:hypothetical protein
MALSKGKTTIEQAYQEYSNQQVQMFFEKNIKRYHPHNPQAIMTSINLIMASYSQQEMMLDILKSISPHYYKMWQKLTLIS